MNKSGTGHVEIIISFVLFIGFLAFILIAFNPLKGPPNPAIVNSVYNGLEENLSVELNKVSINLDSTTGQSCFVLKDSNNLVSDLKCNNQNIIIRDKNNNKKYAEIVSGEIVSEITSENNFYTIYCSDEIEPVTGSINLNLCKEYLGEEYEIGIIVSANYWSLKKITQLENSYLNNYPVIKKEFIRDTSDFGFIIWNLDSSKDFDVTQEIPRGLDVVSKTLPISIIDFEANITRHTITVMTW